ncbi:hypothetical protein N7G274_000842 [Stereocaulon virgatum]|uniref:CST complex subunit STN1 n=1 Tax=Stereocaulon virgatum TaxID=373712 RepID=A0ABR4AMT8_9LECA
MQTSLSTPLRFYPAYCFSLSPTHEAWARLTAVDVHALQERAGFEGQNLYFHLNHPIKWIRLVGVIVAIDEWPTRLVMLLDDSSGALVEVTCARPRPTLKAPVPDEHNLKDMISVKPTTGVTATGRTIDLDGIEIGTVVKVKGGVKTYRSERQMQLERIVIIRTTNEEAAAWAENTAFRRDILNIPWVVSEKDEERARRKAEGLDREKKAREDRKRRTQRAKLNSKLNTQEKNQKAQEERRHAAAEGKKTRRAEAICATTEKESAITEEAQCAILQHEQQRNEGAVGVDAEKQKRERDKRRREYERRLREQEYERLKGLKRDS